MVLLVFMTVSSIIKYAQVGKHDLLLLNVEKLEEVDAVTSTTSITARARDIRHR
jgi:hypothetical protein